MRRPSHTFATILCIVMLVAVTFAGVAYNPAVFTRGAGTAIGSTPPSSAQTVNFAPAEERENDVEDDDLDDVTFDDAEHHRAPSCVLPTSVAQWGLTSLLAADRLHRPPIG